MEMSVPPSGWVVPQDTVACGDKFGVFAPEMLMVPTKGLVFPLHPTSLGA